MHLKPLEKSGLVDAWSDQRIKVGDLWRTEIETALSRAQVAILLISPAFIASDFIVENELPPLLSRAQNQGVRVMPLVVRTCRFTREPKLSVFQSVNDPNTPLAAMQDWQRDVYYDKIANAIEEVFA